MSNFSNKTFSVKLVPLEFENKELNNNNKEGILIKPLRSVLFNKAKLITHSCEGLIKVKNL